MITKKVELIEKKEFVITTLDSQNKVFVVYIDSVSKNSDI